MPFLIQDTAEKIFTAYGREFLVQEGPSFDIQTDIYRAKFLGSLEQEKLFIEQWTSLSEEQKKKYSQGNIDHNNLFMILSPQPMQRLRKEDESREDYLNQEGYASFGYLTDSGELASMMLIYRKDDPSKWVISICKNPNLEPKDRQIILLSGFDLKPLSQETNGLDSLQVTASENALLEQLDSAFLREFVFDVQNGEELDNKAEAINFIARVLNSEDSKNANLHPLDLSKTPLEFLADPIIRTIYQHKIELSTEMRMDYLFVANGLRQHLEQLVTQDPEKDKKLIPIVVALYEQKLLTESNKNFVKQQVIPQIHLFEQKQIALTPFLIQKNYPSDLFHLILSKPEYYNAVAFLKQYAVGLTQNVALYFADQDKLAQLDYIAQLSCEQQRKVCYLFWAKSTKTLDEIKKLVGEMNSYSPLPQIILKLDKSSMFMDELYELALDSKARTIQSISNLAVDVFKDQQFDSKDLNDLDLEALTRLEQCMHVLNNNRIPSISTLYKKVLDADRSGQLLRAFLPDVQKQNPTTQRTLVECLFKHLAGVGVGASQGTQSPVIEQFNEVFTCVSQLQRLGFAEAELRFTAQSQDLKAHCFRRIILEAENTLKKIQVQFHTSSTSLGGWPAAEKEYRSKLYHLVYEELHNPTTDRQARIDAIQKDVLDLIDPQDRSWVHKALIGLANFIITVLSLGIAPLVKYAQTGSPWFFKHTASGEELHRFTESVTAEIDEVNLSAAAAGG